MSVITVNSTSTPRLCFVCLVVNHCLWSIMVLPSPGDKGWSKLSSAGLLGDVYIGPLHQLSAAGIHQTLDRPSLALANMLGACYHASCSPPSWAAPMWVAQIGVHQGTLQFWPVSQAFLHGKPSRGTKERKGLHAYLGLLGTWRWEVPRQSFIITKHNPLEFCLTYWLG